MPPRWQEFAVQATTAKLAVPSLSPALLALIGQRREDRTGVTVNHALTVSAPHFEFHTVSMECSLTSTVQV